MDIDLQSVVIVNESSDPNLVGDVTIFRTKSEAAMYIEPIDVLNREYQVYSIDGQMLDLDILNGEVRIERSKINKNKSDRLRVILESAAETVLSARGRIGRGKAKESVLSLSIKELVELVGLSK